MLLLIQSVWSINESRCCFSCQYFFFHYEKGKIEFKYSSFPRFPFRRTVNLLTFLEMWPEWVESNGNLLNNCIRVAMSSRLAHIRYKKNPHKNEFTKKRKKEIENARKKKLLVEWKMMSTHCTNDITHHNTRTVHMRKQTIWL